MVPGRSRSAGSGSAGSGSTATVAAGAAFAFAISVPVSVPVPAEIGQFDSFPGTRILGKLFHAWERSWIDGRIQAPPYGRKPIHIAFADEIVEHGFWIVRIED
jgi:hypothetical protein